MVAVSRRHRLLKKPKHHSSIKEVSSNSVIHVVNRSIDNKPTNHQKSNSTIWNKTHFQDRSITQQSNAIHSVRVMKIRHHSLRKTENDRLSNINISVGSDKQSSQNIWSKNYTTPTVDKKLDSTSTIISYHPRTISTDERSLLSRSAKVVHDKSNHSLYTSDHHSDSKSLSIKQSNKWDSTNEYHRNKNRRAYKYFFHKYCQCSRICIIASICAAIILSIIIALILVATLTKPSNKITTATRTTRTTTTAITTITNINQTLFVDENTRINITCFPPTPSINILYAYYGSLNCTVCNCTRMDYTYNISMYCANSGNPSFCTFEARNSFFGDTCVGVRKNFWLTYICY